MSNFSIDQKHSQSSTSTPAFDIVAIAASAGGLNALTQVLPHLPADFPVAVVVVQHLSPKHHSNLAKIFSRRVQLPVKQAEDGEKLSAGTIYLAPPNHHLLVTSNNTVKLTQTEKTHFVRPSADNLFESVAEVYQKRAIAVILSGSGSDGVTGIRAIHAHGGTILVQDKESSEFPGMPQAATQTGLVDHTLPIDRIASVIVQLVTHGTLHDGN